MDLVIHDYPASDWERIADKYAGWTVISDNGTIRPCIGCFNCWTSGTGRCVIEDGYDSMGELIHQADQMVVMSRYTYGGFSSFVKNVFDRSLGYVLPEFEAAYSEMHHKKRYDEDRPVTFCFRGEGLTEEDRAKARKYVEAVCRNLRGTVKEVIFEECTSEEPAVSTATLPEERSGILLVDCSLRGARSNTRRFMRQLQAYLGTVVDVISLSAGVSAEEAADAIGRAETVVMGVPLYVDGIPASALRLMEAVKARGAGNGCKVYAVVNNGLYESRQNENLISMIRDWCSGSGSTYLGAAAIGAGELVGTLIKGGQSPLWPVNNALSVLRQLAEDIKAGKATDTLYADPYRFPRWLYILIANSNWQILKAASRLKNRKGLL